MMLRISALSAIIVCFIVLGSPAWAGYQFYGASLDEAKWRSSGNRLQCSLSQIIPGYGKATFQHRALHAMEFRVSSNYTPKKPVRRCFLLLPRIGKSMPVKRC